MWSTKHVHQPPSKCLLVQREQFRPWCWAHIIGFMSPPTQRVLKPSRTKLTVVCDFETHEASNTSFHFGDFNESPACDTKFDSLAGAKRRQIDQQCAVDAQLRATRLVVERIADHHSAASELCVFWEIDLPNKMFIWYMCFLLYFGIDWWGSRARTPTTQTEFFENTCLHRAFCRKWPIYHNLRFRLAVLKSQRPPRNNSTRSPLRPFHTVRSPKATWGEAKALDTIDTQMCKTSGELTCIDTHLAF